MHKRRERSDRGVPRYNLERKPRGKGGKGFRHPLFDREAFKRVMEAFGGVARAAEKIGCNHTALSRLCNGSSARVSHQIAAAITKAIHELPEDQRGEVERDWDSVTLPKEAQRRLTEYFAHMGDSLKQAYSVPWRIMYRNELYERYGKEGGILREFEEWMNKRPVPIRKMRQDLAFFRVLQPLFDGIETGWMEVGWKELIRKDQDGKIDDSRLVKVLKSGIAREKILLKARGPDQERARRLAACAEAHVALTRVAPEGAVGEEVDAARQHRADVYRAQRIPSSYILGIPAEGSNDAPKEEPIPAADVEMVALSSS